MNKYFAVLGIILVATVGYFFINNSRSSITRSSEDVHLHAGFQVYIDNELQDYSGLQYMKISPCYEGEKPELTAEEEQLEKAHLHDNNGDVVHVHREGALWGDLFTNSGITLNKDNITAYVNGNKVDNIFITAINPYDTVVIFQGQNDDIDEKLTKAVTKEKIVEVENVSESCGS